MTELGRLLNALNEKFGKTRLSKIHKTEYVFIDKENRKEALWYLIKTLEQKGKDRDYFETPSVQSEIAEFFMPDIEGFPKNKIKGGRAVVKNELASVIERVWPTELYDGEAPPKDVIEPTKEHPKQDQEDNLPIRVGREVDQKLYKELDRPEIDEEFAALIGVDKDE